jgi:maltooligosyltrehalose trehalohydrolase
MDPGLAPEAAVSQDGVRFCVWAPRAQRVELRLTKGDVLAPLQPAGRGYFGADVPEAGPGSDYVYRLDGTAEHPDPASRHQPDGVHGPSRVLAHDFPWSDAAWRGVERRDLVIYELHVGTFSEGGSFEAVIPHLEALAELGVTALELMPVAEFPGSRNWGYDGVFPFAAQSSYGGPDGLRRLVDAAHAAGLAVLLDVVYNHLGPEGNVLGAFGPYFTDRYRTPWGEAINFDGPDSDEVRRYFVANALHWIEGFHVDGLRLDAVHAIHDQSARPFLAELGDAVHGAAERLGRRIHVIAESDANDPRLVRSGEAGGLGLDAVWCDDFHHAVHARLTGERDGYYADFGSTEQVARALGQRFVYDGGYSGYRRRRHGAPAGDLAADRFVVFIQNHDQVGNRAAGDRLSRLLSPEKLRLAAALLLLSPSLPLLFMGEEYGETAPFAYFVDHGDPELVEAVRRGRRAEFASFAARGEVPDPADPQTFLGSRLHREGGDPGLRALYRELLRLRREEPALRTGAAALQVDCRVDWIRVQYRAAPGRPLFAAFPLAAGEVVAPEGGPWRRLLASDDAGFGGPGTAAPERCVEGDRIQASGPAALLYAGEAA